MGPCLHVIAVNAGLKNGFTHNVSQLTGVWQLLRFPATKTQASLRICLCYSPIRSIDRDEDLDHLFIFI